MGLVKHFRYLKYVLRHKWYVFVECAKRGLIWRGLVHDLSKFLPDEWLPYTNYFYGKEFNDRRFRAAWNRHIHRNPHHWQYWILTQDEDPRMILPMPHQYRVEMLCDWIGAGKVQGHGNDVLEWYTKQRENIVLHPETQAWIEKEIGYAG